MVAGGTIEDLQRAARFELASPYPAEIHNGGLGVRLAISDVSARVALVGTSGADGASLILYNPNDFDVCVAFGDNTAAATLAHYPVRAGDKEIVTVPGDVTYIAVIAGSGNSGFFYAHRCFGV
jgi:hypothetical protein